MKRKLLVALSVLFFVGLCVVLGLLVWANQPIDALPVGVVADRILVEKGKRQMTLFANGDILKVYEISLGRAPVGAKEKEGDLKTPEGTYRIIEHFEPSAFHRSLRISYPDASDIEKAKAQGVSPGSDIMIHGMRNGLGLVGRLHLTFDWTAGCIAVTNAEINELWRVVPDGTVIEIHK